uniref:serine/threonine-protein kinase LMTK1 isoform X2 n=1 Tax=Myxine glutinosa TaxID=7769 RepID=UPI00358ED239
MARRSPAVRTAAPWAVGAAMAAGVAVGAPLPLFNPDVTVWGTDFLSSSGILVTVLSCSGLLVFLVLILACTCCKRSGVSFKEFENTDAEDEDLTAFSPPVSDVPSSPSGHDVYVLPLNELSHGGQNHLFGTDTSRSGGVVRQSLSYVQEIGRGWFGKVLLGEIFAGFNPSRVVVKELRANATPGQQQRFLNQAHAYRLLQHPNILQCLGQCTERTPYLLVMELCTLGDVKGYIRGQAGVPGGLLDIEQLMRMAHEISAGLTHMHRHGYIHRFSLGTSCWLPGAACAMFPFGSPSREDYYMTAEKLSIPLRWIAPELLDDVHGNIVLAGQSRASNLWSLGVTLWELLELGIQPYRHLSDREVLAYVIKEQQVRLPKPRLDLPHSDRWYEVLQFCWLPSEQRPLTEELHLLLTYLYNRRHRDSEDGFERQWNALKPTCTVENATVNSGEPSTYHLSESYSSDGLQDEVDDVLTVTETSQGLAFEYSWERPGYLGRVVTDSLPVHNEQTVFSHSSEMYQSKDILGARSSGLGGRFTTLECCSSGHSGLIPPTSKLPVLAAGSPSVCGDYFVRLEERACHENNRSMDLESSSGGSSSSSSSGGGADGGETGDVLNQKADDDCDSLLRNRFSILQSAGIEEMRTEFLSHHGRSLSPASTLANEPLVGHDNEKNSYPDVFQESSDDELDSESAHLLGDMRRYSLHELPSHERYRVGQGAHTMGVYAGRAAAAAFPAPGESCSFDAGSASRGMTFWNSLNMSTPREDHLGLTPRAPPPPPPTSDRFPRTVSVMRLSDLKIRPRNGSPDSPAEHSAPPFFQHGPRSFSQDQVAEALIHCSQDGGTDFGLLYPDRPLPAAAVFPNLSSFSYCDSTRPEQYGPDFSPFPSTVAGQDVGDEEDSHCYSTEDCGLLLCDGPQVFDGTPEFTGADYPQDSEKDFCHFVAAPCNSIANRGPDEVCLHRARCHLVRAGCCAPGYIIPHHCAYPLRSSHCCELPNNVLHNCECERHRMGLENPDNPSRYSHLMEGVHLQQVTGVSNCHGFSEQMGRPEYDGFDDNFHSVDQDTESLTSCDGTQDILIKGSSTVSSWSSRSPILVVSESMNCLDPQDYLADHSNSAIPSDSVNENKETGMKIQWETLDTERSSTNKELDEEGSDKEEQVENIPQDIIPSFEIDQMKDEPCEVPQSTTNDQELQAISPEVSGQPCDAVVDFDSPVSNLSPHQVGAADSGYDTENVESPAPSGQEPVKLRQQGGKAATTEMSDGPLHELSINTGTLELGCDKNKQSECGEKDKKQELSRLEPPNRDSAYFSDYDLDSENPSTEESKYLEGSEKDDLQLQPKSFTVTAIAMNLEDQRVVDKCWTHLKENKTSCLSGVEDVGFEGVSIPHKPNDQDKYVSLTRLQDNSVTSIVENQTVLLDDLLQPQKYVSCTSLITDNSETESQSKSVVLLPQAAFSVTPVGESDAPVHSSKEGFEDLENVSLQTEKSHEKKDSQCSREDSEDEENSEDSDDDMMCYSVQGNSSESEGEELGTAAIPIVVTGPTDGRILRSMLRDAPEPPPGIVEQDSSCRKKMVSFFDDVTVYLFDEESPTSELGEKPYADDVNSTEIDAAEGVDVPVSPALNTSTPPESSGCLTEGCSERQESPDRTTSSSHAWQPEEIPVKLEGPTISSVHGDEPDTNTELPSNSPPSQESCTASSRFSVTRVSDGESSHGNLNTNTGDNGVAAR